MDPQVGVNVAYSARLDQMDPKEAEIERDRMISEISLATSPYEAAGTLRIDEVIDPADTRRVLVNDLRQLDGRRVPAPEDRPLSYWPTV